MGVAKKTTEIIGKVMEAFFGEDVTISAIEKMKDRTLFNTND